MRIARCISCLGVLATLVVLSSLPHLVPYAAADPPLSDSTAAPAPAPDSVLTVYPVRGEWFEAVYLSYWSMDTFRYRKASGETGYLAANKIRSIEDAEGNDRFELMIERKSSFGAPGPDEKRSLTSWLKAPFLSKPYRERGGYLVLEFGMSTRLGDGRSTGAYGPLYMSGIGGIRNLSPRWGLGGVVQFISDANNYQALAAGVRLRRYLNETYTLETTHGLFADGDGSRDLRGIPYFGEVALSAAGVVSLFVRAEAHRFAVMRYAFGAYPEWIGVSENALHVGLRLGPRPGYLTVPGMVIGSLMVLTPRGHDVY